MAVSRVIEVSFGRSSVALVRIDTAYFYNNGILFKPTDIDLPASYQVHWADSPQAATTLETIGTADGAPIPDDLWDRSRVIYGWIYLHPTEDSSVTGYEVRIYKNVRAGLPDGTEPTPAEQSTIDQAISALNTAVAKTAQDVISADQSARSASGDADRAERARTGAETAQGKAEEAQESAERAKNDAETSERNASESERNAKGYAETASEKADSIHSMTASAQTLPAGSSASASYNAETGIMSFGIPKGKDGTDGEDGYSPTADVSKTGKVATITITDKNGTTSAQVEDGEDGTDGIDGISPSVSVTDITGGHRVVITDKDGTKSFDVEDGATGATPNLTIGTVTTLEPDASATATITGTAENPVLNLGLPRGQTGEVTEEEFTQLKEDLTDIRVGADGTTYNSAGAAVRGQISNVKNDIDYSLGTEKDLTNNYISGGYIKLAYSVGSTIDVTNVTASNNYAYIVVPCRKGDVFTISGYAGSNPRLWAFTDNLYKLLSVANAELTVTELSMTAGQDGYFISDVNIASGYELAHTCIDNVTEQIKSLDSRVNDLEETTIKGIAQIRNRYYNAGTGVLTYNSGLSCTNLIKVNPYDKLKITTSCGDSVGVAGYNANKVYNSRIMETGGTAIYKVERGILTTEITVPSDVYYITVSNVAPDSTDIIVKSMNPKANEENPITDMLIVPRDSTHFDVYSKAEVNGKYLRHHFVKQYYTDTLLYGDGLSKSVVGADIWYSDMIADGSTSVMAGNFNFIHNISNMTNDHKGYVGAGHGCTVMDWCIFKADGESVDPTSIQLPIECTTFDFVIKAKNYLIDKPNSPSESHAVPTLDSNGNPIVTSVNIINAKMRVGNEIEYRNRLIFKMNGIQFSECHGSMCEGYFAAFDNIIIENIEESWNYIDASDDYARTKMNGTQLDVFTAGSKKALSVIMFGDKYKVENKLIQMDSTRNKITNTRTALYRDNGARMKVYLMPVVCTISAENIDDGATVETFNTGDILDVVSYRKITVS